MGLLGFLDVVLGSLTCTPFSNCGALHHRSMASSRLVSLKVVAGVPVGLDWLSSGMLGVASALSRFAA